MNLTLLQFSIAMALITISLHPHAEEISTENASIPVAEFNYQNDYICTAKPGNLITSGKLDFSSVNTQRFGFTYPVKVKSIWLKDEVQSNWIQFELNSKLRFAKYKGIRFDINQTTSHCSQGDVSTMVKDNHKKEALVSVNLCTSAALNADQIQILFEAVN